MHDGTITEHGDGFSLTSIDLEDANETSGIVIKSVPVEDGVTILVGGEASIMFGSFTIGRASRKFTYEPAATSSPVAAKP